MEDIIKEAKVARSNSKRQFTLKANKIKSMITNKVDASLIEVYMADLDSLWGELNQYHCKYISLAEENVDENENDDYLDIPFDTMATVRDLFLPIKYQTTEQNLMLQPTVSPELKAAVSLTKQLTSDLQFILQAESSTQDIEAKKGEIDKHLSNLSLIVVAVEIDHPDDYTTIHDFVDITRHEALSISSEAGKIIQTHHKKPTDNDEHTTEADVIRQRKVGPQIFEGDIRLYYPWKFTHRQNFESKNPKTAVMQLLEALGKNPKALVAHMSIYNSVEPMYVMLDHKYGDKRRISRLILSDVESLLPCRPNKVDDFRNLQETISKARSELKAIDCEGHLAHYNTVIVIERKLPREYKSDWARISISPEITIENKFDKLIEFIDNSVLVAEQLQEMNISDQTDLTTANDTYTNENGVYKTNTKGTEREHYTQPSSKTEHINPANNNTSDSDDTCPLHGRHVAHSIEQCHNLKRASIEKQVEMLTSSLKDHCRVCLQIGHGKSGINCKAKIPACGKNECQLKHKPFLHDALDVLRKQESGSKIYSTAVSSNHVSDNSKLKNQDEHTYTPTQGMTLNQFHSNSICPAQYAALYDICDDSFRSVSVLHDCGANVSLILNSLVSEMNLKKKEEQPWLLVFSTVTEESVQIVSYRYELPLYNRHTNQLCYTATAFGVDHIGADFATLEANVQIAAHELGVIEEYNTGRIARPEGPLELLIGTDNGMCLPEKLKSIEGLIFCKNKLGPMIFGSHSTFRKQDQKFFKAQVLAVQSELLVVDNKLRDFFSTEALGVEVAVKCGDCKCGGCPINRSELSFREQQEQDRICELMNRDPETNIITAGYPTVKDITTLKDNKPLAVKRTEATEAQLAKDPPLAAKYQGQFVDMIEKGIARKLTEEQERDWSGPVQYLPHKPVINLSSLSTPVRWVLDPSAQYKGQCVNDFWAKGANLIHNSLGILIRFSEDLFAVVGDIQKMYQSIHTTPNEWHLHRFLWRDCDPSQEFSVYVITRNSFGSKPASAVALAALELVAKDGSSDFPRGAQCIRRQSYVDDIMDSTDSMESGKSLTKEVDACLDLGSFVIKPPGWLYVDGESARQNFELHEPSSAGISPNDEESKGHQPSNVSSSPNDETSIIELKLGGDESVLGLKWNIVGDYYCFHPCLNFSKRKRKIRQGPNLEPGEIFDELIVPVLTRRLVLSQIMGLYDPRGLIAPFTTRLKILMAQLVQFRLPDGSELEWDDRIPSKLDKEFRRMFDQMFALKQLRFQRFLKHPDAVGQPWLLMCSDSSTHCFGAVGYIRWRLKNGAYWSRLIASKTKIWPIDPDDYLSVAKGELQGAIMAKRLGKFIQEETRFDIARTIYLVDSEIVRAQISKDSHACDIFTGRRVAEIRRHTQPSDWYWIQGKDNTSADLLSRGTEDMALMNEQSEWQNGLNFFKLDFENWPVYQSVRENVIIPGLKKNQADIPDAKTEKNLPIKGHDLREIQQNHVLLTTCSNGEARSSDQPERVQNPQVNKEREKFIAKSIQLTLKTFNRLDSLHAVTARITRLAHLTRGDSILSAICEPRIVSIEEREEARALWLRQSQVGLDKLLKSSTSRRIAPFIDEQGLYRANGRFKKGEGYHPIILPAQHHYTYLCVLKIHQRGHGGITVTAAKTREDYHILGLGRLVTQICKECVTCRYLQHRTVVVPMAKLPNHRIRAYLPFEHASCDLFGPFLLKVPGRVTRGRPMENYGKGFGVIWTCLSARAVHIEAMEGADTQAFLMAFRRMMTIRGQPRYMWSDQGSQIVSADEELREIVEGWDKATLEQFGALNGIRWEYAMAGSPWQNGVTEALVKSTKKVMKTLFDEKPRLPIIELQTIFYEIASIVNERPLNFSHQETATDPDINSYICPNQLLLGRATARISAGPFPPVSLSDKRRLLVVQQITTEFWDRWYKLVYPLLLPQSKWHRETRAIRAGDIVHVRDINPVRGDWRLAEVITAEPSEDGYVRHVTLRYKNIHTKDTGANYRGAPDRTEQRDVKNLVVILTSEERQGAEIQDDKDEN